MAGDQLTLNGKVRASSILEVVIAMVLILIVFSLAMLISANVMRSSLALKNIRAQAVLNELLLQAEQSREISSQTSTIAQLSIVQEVKPAENYPGLLAISLTAYDLNQKKVAELKKMILNKDE